MSDTEFIYAIEAPSYVAITNTPGYLPESDPVEFDTAAEAWQYLADERERWENEASDGCNDEVCDPTCPWRSEADLSETWQELTSLATAVVSQPGAVWGDTPGYHGDHDLGVAYSVAVAETD
jgi:hypothetical protein